MLLGVIRRLCREKGRDRPVPGAGVGNGGNRVRFQEVPEDTAAG